jgi:hypothetical protein
MKAEWPEWVPVWLGEHPHDSTAREKLTALANAGNVPLAYSGPWVGRHLGASYGEEDPWPQSAAGKAAKKKYAKIEHMPNKTSEQFEARAAAKRAYARELIDMIHGPDLMALADRWNTGALFGSPGQKASSGDENTPPTKYIPPSGDYAIAWHWLKEHPRPPSKDDHRMPPGWSMEGAAPMYEYSEKQAYGYAKEFFEELESERRKLDQLTLAQINSAKADAERYVTYVPSETPQESFGYGRMPTEFPPGLYHIMCAYSYGEFMRGDESREYDSALAWWHYVDYMAALGRSDQPKPGDSGYTPLPPNPDPYWQLKEHPRVEKGGN